MRKLLLRNDSCGDSRCRHCDITVGADENIGIQATGIHYRDEVVTGQLVHASFNRCWCSVLYHQLHLYRSIDYSPTAAQFWTIAISRKPAAWKMTDTGEDGKWICSKSCGRTVGLCPCWLADGRRFPTAQHFFAVVLPSHRHVHSISSLLHRTLTSFQATFDHVTTTATWQRNNCVVFSPGVGQTW